MTPHIITPAVGVVCSCKAKAFTTGPPYPNTLVITAHIESNSSKFVAEDDLVPFCCSLIPSCVAGLQTEASVEGSIGRTFKRALR
ncbi:hypothetical protein TNCV_964331 [Trichonephila clavipes]|nr:hypothetical protein TNCV_964331 [Trichonephila clavipes]